MTSMTSTPAMATHSCPCSYVGTLFRAAKVFKNFGIPFPQLQCQAFETAGLEIISTTTSPADFRILAATDPDNCPTDFCCSTFFFATGAMSPSTGLSGIGIEYETTAEQDASCRRQLRAIARWKQLECPAQ